MLVALVGACNFSPPAAPIVDATLDDAPVDLPIDTSSSPRVAGARGFWKFDELAGNTVLDHATPPSGKLAMDLTIAMPGETVWVTGGLQIIGRGTISSTSAPHIGQTIQNVKEVTVEAWVTPTNDVQGDGTDPFDGAPDYAAVFMASGSIVSYSALIAQTGDRWITRSRTNTPPTQPERAAGFPEIQAPSASAMANKVTHLVLVTSATTRTLYVDGVPQTSTPEGLGTLDWDPSYALRFADHSAGYERGWQGTLWVVALYDRSLLPQEVQQNFEAGHDCLDC